MKKSILVLASLLALSMMAGGCATILSGQRQTINIISQDSTKKYTVKIDGQIFNAPGIIEIKRENRDKIVTVEECPGQQILLRKEINPLIIVNILSAGLIGSATDYMTDSMWKYEPSAIYVGCK